MSDPGERYRDANQRFIGSARARKLISEEQADRLLRLAELQSTPVGQLAIESAAMSPPQVEIAEAFIDPDDLAPGFRLLDVIGQGALGVVYRAHQSRMRRDVAIKAIMQSRLHQSNVLQRFQNESEAIGRLQHPNIVSAFDSGTHRGRVYLVMELVEGIDLRIRIKQGPIPISHALSIVRQTASGLAHAASHQIIHRDIKPANLMLTQASTGFDLPDGAPLVKIADFGLARLTQLHSSEEAELLTMTGTALGTPMYCAPEQLTGDPVDHRADIYALGATLFSMLSGEPPFEGGTTNRLIAAKITGQSPRFERLPQNLAPEIRLLIADMMHQDPDSRIGSYAELIRRVDEQMSSSDMEDTMLPGVRPTVRPSSASPTLSNRFLGGMRRMPRRAILTAALILIAGLIVMIWTSVKNMLVRSTPLPPTIETVWSEALFDGQSLAGWTNHQSVWRVSDDAEGSRVLAGKGRISRDLGSPPAIVSSSIIALGVRVRVNLITAKAAEVRFAFEGASDKSGSNDRAEHWVVHMTAEEVEVGRQSSANDSPDSVASIAIKPGTPSDGPNWKEIQIQRHADRWYVVLEGELVGSFQSPAPLAGNSIELVAIDGEAHFSDLSMFGLEPEP